MVYQVRKVYCDMCGEEIKDLFGGYNVVGMGSRGHLYDICDRCAATIDADSKLWEDDIISTFTWKDGRES